MDKKESLIAEQTKNKKTIQQLENRQKIFLNRIRLEERRARNHRLIEHGAILESVFPTIVSMEGKTVKAFLIALSRLPGAVASCGRDGALRSPSPLRASKTKHPLCVNSVFAGLLSPPLKGGVIYSNLSLSYQDHQAKRRPFGCCCCCLSER